MSLSLYGVPDGQQRAVFLYYQSKNTRRKMDSAINIEREVKERYTGAARDREAELCCPVDYDAKLLKVIPNEIKDRDYGCGDPSGYVKPKTGNFVHQPSTTACKPITQ